jgi:hypothetical protein
MEGKNLANFETIFYFAYALLSDRLEKSSWKYIYICQYDYHALSYTALDFIELCVKKYFIRLCLDFMFTFGLYYSNEKSFEKYTKTYLFLNFC